MGILHPIFEMIAVSGIILVIFVIVTLMKKRFPKKVLSVLIIVNRFI